MVKPEKPITDPDLVDYIFDYIVAEFPEMSSKAQAFKEIARKEFAGTATYIPLRSQTEKQQKINEVLRLFNGRNATEVARRLNISRASVYRFIKTAGR